VANNFRNKNNLPMKPQPNATSFRILHFSAKDLLKKKKKEKDNCIPFPPIIFILFYFQRREWRRKWNKKNGKEGGETEGF